MRKGKWTILIILLALFCSAASPRALAAGQLLSNGELAGEGVPAGWMVQSYLAGDYTVAASDGAAELTSTDYNDLRLLQRVEVEENSVYILTAEVSASHVMGGKGACLSIDNYSIDGAYIYSEGILGSADWTPVTLAFSTGEGQTEILAALRLGGYSQMSQGAARFRNVRLERAENGAVGVIPLEAGSTAPAAPQQQEDAKAREIRLKSYLHLFVVIALTAAAVMVFGFYRGRESLGGRGVRAGYRWKYFALLVLGGYVLRSLLSAAWGGHDTDMSCWMGWGNYIASRGPSAFYTAPGHEWYDYPPGYMLVLGCIARLLSALHIQSGAGAAVFAYMLPAYIADVCVALLVMHYARRRGFSEGWQLLLAGLVVFNPAAVTLSGAWGQIDSILTLFLLLSFLELSEGRRVAAGAVYGLAIMIKWQALIYGPVLGCAYLLHIRTKRDALKTVGGVAAAVAVMLLLSLPFKGEQGLFWFVGRFLSAAGGYDYASVEAYNFLALCGGNWTKAAKDLIPGVSFRVFGTVAILLSVAAALLLQLRTAAREGIGSDFSRRDTAALFLSAALCMYGIFTFGHYMHERYVFPVIWLLTFVFIYTREPKYLLCSLLLSAVLFLNEMTAMFVISDLASAVVRSSREHRDVVRLCSALETASFVYFVWVCLHRGTADTGEEAEENA